MGKRPAKASFTGVTTGGGGPGTEAGAEFGGVPTGFNVRRGAGGGGAGGGGAVEYFQGGGGDSMTSFPMAVPGGGAAGGGPGGSAFEVTDANGNVIGSFDTLEALKAFSPDTMEEYDTGEREGGFGQKFYDEYKQKYKNLYTPEIADQYEDARERTIYQHADAHTLPSTMYNENLVDLVEQNEKNLEQLGVKADTATTNLKLGIDAQKNAMIDAVYSTENPELAANLATNSVKTLTDARPEYSAIGDVFKVATIGAGNFLNSYYDPYRRMGSPNRTGGSYNVG